MAQRKRKLSQTPSARTLRQATAFWRLYWKATRNGDGAANTYFKQATALQEKGYRMRDREQQREAEKKAWQEKMANRGMNPG